MRIGLFPNQKFIQFDYYDEFEGFTGELLLDDQVYNIDPVMGTGEISGSFSGIVWNDDGFPNNIVGQIEIEITQ